MKKRVRELVQGAFLDSVWDEMPTAWTDVGEAVLSLETIRRVIMEGCHG